MHDGPGDASQEGDSSAPASAGASPRVLGDFRILRELGRGAMGMVFEAEQLSLRRRVALKVIAAHLTLDERALQRFQHEAAITARLSHPGIVRIHQVGELAGVHFIAMELVEGSSLYAILERMRVESFGARQLKSVSDVVSLHGLEEPVAAPRPAPEGTRERAPRPPSSAANSGYIENTLKLVCQVADALHHAHQAGVLHRDVKPSNILVRGDGSAVLTDFGLAREDGLPMLSRTGDFVGTPHYVSPEQAMAGRVKLDHRSDVFSLGATLFELLTLELPFPGETVHEVLASVLSKPPRNPRKLNSALAPDLVTIVLKALEKDPDQRYASAADLAADLRAFLAYRPIRARRTPAVVRVLRWVKREPLKAALGFVLTVGLPLGTWQGFELAASRERVVAQELPARIADGFLALGLGDVADSEHAFAEVLAQDPASVESVAGLALALLAQERAAEALLALTSFQERFGATPIVERLRVDALRGTGDEREAQRVEQTLAEPAAPLEKYVEALRLVHDRPFLSDTPRTSALFSPGRRAGPARDALDGGSEDDTQVRARAQAARAIELLTRAIGVESERAPYHFALAWAVWIARDRNEASRVADAIVAKWPGMPVARFYAGLACEVFDEEAAMGHFDLALAGEPELSAAISRRAIVLLGRGEHERAVQDLRALVEREPEHVTHRVSLAFALLEARQVDEAVRVCREVLAQDPGRVDALDVLGTAQHALGNLAAARDAFRAAVELEPLGARLHNDLGLVLLELGESAQAVAELEQAHRLAPENPFAAYNLGLAYTQMRRSEEGVAAFERAIAAHGELPVPGFPLDSAWGALGVAHSLSRRSKEAIEALTEAVTLAPLDPVHNAGLGAELYRLKRYAESIDPLRRGLALDGDGRVHSALVESLCAVRRRAEALEVAKSWTERLPSHAEAWNQRAWIQADPAASPAVGDPEDALRSAEEAQRLSGGPLHGILDTKACALFRAGRIDEAVEAALEAIRLAEARNATNTELDTLNAHIELFEAATR